MARTRHHRHQSRHHANEDFWSKRAGMGNHCYSTYGKKLTIRKERMEEKKLLIKEVRNSV